MRSVTSWYALGTILATAAVLTAACTPPGNTAPQEPADLILENGRVYTLAWDEPALDGTPSASAPFRDGAWHPDAEAVAVRGGRIVFVGSTADAAAYRGDATRVVDLGGATVVPGLVDSHTHVAGLGKNLERVDLTRAMNEAEAVDLVAARAADMPAGQWIEAWGWDEGLWAGNYPDMKLLSAKVPDHPVVMQSLHGFAVWGNRLAFERAGITRGTKAPSGGEIRVDESGEPDGILLNRATALLTGAVPPPTPEKLATQVLAGLEEMARSGYVAVHDAGVGPELMAAFESLAAEGRLPVRVYAMLNGRDEEQMRAWLETGPKTDDDKLVRRSVKAYYDGALGSRGARLLEPYADTPGHHGVSGGQYGFNQKLMAEMIGAGFQVAVHAIGDAGNRESLDFFDEAFAAYPEGRAGRHRIEHAQVVHPDDFARFAEMDIIASMQPQHAVEDKAWAEERLGPERVRGAYAWRTLRQGGVRLIFNSDLAGSDHDIFYGLHSAITRRDKHLEPEGGWYPDQALTPEEAVRAFTVWPAFAAFQEDETGALQAGRLADITVLDVDPFHLGLTDPGSLLGGSVRMTVVGGEIVHESP